MKQRGNVAPSSKDVLDPSGKVMDAKSEMQSTAQRTDAERLTWGYGIFGVGSVFLGCDHFSVCCNLDIIRWRYGQVFKRYLVSLLELRHVLPNRLDIPCHIITWTFCEPSVFEQISYNVTDPRYPPNLGNTSELSSPANIVKY